MVPKNYHLYFTLKYFFLIQACACVAVGILRLKHLKELDHSAVLLLIFLQPLLTYSLLFLRARVSFLTLVYMSLHMNVRKCSFLESLSSSSPPSTPVSQASQQSMTYSRESCPQCKRRINENQSSRSHSCGCRFHTLHYNKWFFALTILCIFFP